jgi:RNA polymerase sigma-70 factor (ECF subfamily)
MQNREERKREFERIMMEHIDSLYNTALRMTRNTADAEDLVQDVCSRSYRFFDKFKRGTNAKAWLLTILRNTYINDFRKSSKRPPTVSLEKMGPLEDSSRQEGFPAFSPFAREEALEQLSSDAVRTAIDELPDELKMVAILFYVEELSYKEIANVVGCPAGTVMSRLYRARKQLRNRLALYAHEKGYQKD